MKVSLATLAFVVLAAVLIPAGGASSEAASSSKKAEQEEQSPAMSTQQNLRRRANAFNNNSNSNSNSANVGVIVVLNDEGRRRKLNGIGEATADERKAAAEENKAAAAAAAESMGAFARVTYGSAIFGFAADIPPGLIKKIEADSRVAYLEMDAVVQLDPMEMGEDRRRLAPPPGKGPGDGGSGGGGGGGGSDPPQTIPWGITRVNGGTGALADYQGGKAWVIDSGIDLDHPDLNVDTANSKSFTRDSTPDDGNGHGTHVAGTIAAIDNEIGVLGVVPGAPVVAVRVLDKRGSGWNSWVIGGIDYVASKCGSSDVANMSLGGGRSDSLNTAVINAAKKCPFVLAAGNEKQNVANVSPASANGANIYTVSAFSSGDFWASFSNYGSGVDYAAPGVYIDSTWKGGGYNVISGTSMAAPHVAGVLLTGSIATDRYVKNDPDGNADPIGVC